MAGTTFSVIVPTVGRATIDATLASITSQLEPGDELLVRCSSDRDFGNGARQSLIERARGSHLIFMDDDDAFLPGALATMRRFADAHPGRIGIFRMVYPDGRILWADPSLRVGNVSTQMLCVPNIPGKLGRWDSPGSPRTADYAFLESTVAVQGEPIFQDAIVARIRPARRSRRVRLAKRARAGWLALRGLTRPLGARPGR